VATLRCFSTGLTKFLINMYYFHIDVMSAETNIFQNENIANLLIKNFVRPGLISVAAEKGRGGGVKGGRREGRGG
jgi:hypothetical protein